MRSIPSRAFIPYILVLGLLLAVVASGCTLNGGGGDQTSQNGTTAARTSGEQTAATAGETTRQMAGKTTARETTRQQAAGQDAGEQDDADGSNAGNQNNNAGGQNGGGQNDAAQQARQQGQGGGQVEVTVQGQPPQQGQQQGQQQDRQGQQQTVTVRVTGTEGVSFSGRVGSSRGVRRVEGSVPQEYDVPFGGAAATVTLRKQQPGEGTLGAEIVRDGQVIASRESSSTTGVVNVVWTSRQGQGN